MSYLRSPCRHWVNTNINQHRLQFLLQCLLKTLSQFSWGTGVVAISSKCQRHLLIMCIMQQCSGSNPTMWQFPLYNNNDISSFSYDKVGSFSARNPSHVSLSTPLYIPLLFITMKIIGSWYLTAKHYESIRVQQLNMLTTTHFTT